MRASLGQYCALNVRLYHAAVFHDKALMGYETSTCPGVTYHRRRKLHHDLRTPLQSAPNCEGYHVAWQVQLHVDLDLEAHN